MQSKANRQAFKVTVIYIIAAGCWNGFCGTLLKKLINGPTGDFETGIIKDFGFAILTGGMLFVILRGLLRRSEEAALRKEADFAALRESELLMRSIMENSKEIIFVKDCECRFVFMNPAGYKLTGLGPEKLIGRSKADFHPNAVEAAQFMAGDRRVMESGRMETIEEEIAAGDGTRHLFLTTKVARLDSQGRVIGLIGIAHDITERKRVETELDYERELLRSLLNSSSDHIYFKLTGNPGSSNAASGRQEKIQRRRPSRKSSEKLISNFSTKSMRAQPARTSRKSSTPAGQSWTRWKG